MFLGKVIGQAEIDESAGDVNSHRLMVVQKLDLYRNANGPSTLAVDFLGADDGDIVIVGPSSPSAAAGPLPLSRSMPIDSLIMGILPGNGSSSAKQPPAG